MLVALAAGSLIPPPDDVRDDDAGGDETTGAVEPPPAFRPDAAEPTQVEFRAGSAADEPRTDRAARENGRRRDESGGGDGPATTAPTVGLDEHVIVTVRTPQPAQIELEGLGLLQTATPGAPAVFDLFTGAPDRHPVLYTPVGGEERRIGTLVVESKAADDGDGG